MATPKPGEIRCPTCHRSTPPAAYCTQCGSAIPSDARARPRGLDRDELQDRIRARRSGGDPFRRGAATDEGPSAAYRRFEPEPDDARARRGAGRPGEERLDYLTERPAAAVRAPAPPPELTREVDDPWGSREPAATIVPPIGSEPPPVEPVEREPEIYDYDEPRYVDNLGPDAAYDYDEAYAEPWERERRGSGAGLAIVGFLVLGVLALLGGAVLAGVFGGDGVAGGPTPNPAVSPVATPDPTTAPATAPSTSDPDGSPGSTGGPVAFPDGFIAEAQPCLPGSANQSGCSSNGGVNSGAVDIWVGFERGTGDDVIGATLISPEGDVLREGSIDLARIGCGATCNGWTRFPFSGLPPGEYTVRVTRNGELADEITFEVT